MKTPKILAWWRNRRPTPAVEVSIPLTAVRPTMTAEEQIALILAVDPRRDLNLDGRRP